MPLVLSLPGSPRLRPGQARRADTEVGSSRQSGRTGIVTYMFKVSAPNLQLSIEMGTADVPDDGRYHIVFMGEVVDSRKSRATAMTEYKERRDALLKAKPVPVASPDAQSVFERMKIDADIRALKAEWVASVGSKPRRGGKGGRGGV